MGDYNDRSFLEGASYIKLILLASLAVFFVSCARVYTSAPDLIQNERVANLVRMEFELIEEYKGGVLLIFSELPDTAWLRTYERIIVERFVWAAWRVAPWSEYLGEYPPLSIGFSLPGSITGSGGSFFFVGLFGWSDYEPTSGALYRVRLPLDVHFSDGYVRHDLAYEFYWP